MIIRELEDAIATSREVSDDNWVSRRLLLEADGMGFSLHDTILHAGTSTPMCYRHHVEAVYCIAGEGRVDDLTSGRTHEIRPGTLYALDGHENHVLHAESELRMVCVFNPPLVGDEVHDETGAYSRRDPERPATPPARRDSAGANPGSDDPYPSRLATEQPMQDRQDPIVWGGHHGPLTPAQLEQFETDGYLFLEGYLDPAEAAGLLEEADRIAATSDLESDDVIAEPESRMIRSVFRLHRTNRRVRELLGSPHICDLPRQILGGDVYVHQSRVNYKRPLDGREFYWHSDFETWHAEDGMPRMRALSASISLTESHEFNGPLMVIPGSHRQFVPCVGATPEHHFRESLRSQRTGVPSSRALEALVERGGIEAPKGPPGSVLLFDCNLMHGSSGNLSVTPRTNLFVVFNSVENALAEPFGAERPRPEFLAERDVVPVGQPV